MRRGESSRLLARFVQLRLGRLGRVVPAQVCAARAIYAVQALSDCRAVLRERVNWSPGSVLVTTETGEIAHSVRLLVRAAYAGQLTCDPAEARWLREIARQVLVEYSGLPAHCRSEHSPALRNLLVAVRESLPRPTS